MKTSLISTLLIIHIMKKNLKTKLNKMPILSLNTQLIFLQVLLIKIIDLVQRVILSVFLTMLKIILPIQLYLHSLLQIKMIKRNNLITKRVKKKISNKLEELLKTNSNNSSNLNNKNKITIM